jgi:hypothetical protein
VKGAESETTTLVLNSQWTDSFSTEIFASTNEMKDSQVTVGPKQMGDHQINVNGFNNTIFLGADDSRQANSLSTQSDFYKFVGKWLVGNHVITGGYEREELEIFNIFVQHSRGGEWDYYDDSGGNPAYCAGLDAQGRMDDPGCGVSGIDRFELGRPSRIYYGSGGGTNVATDAAANFQTNNNALYIQDELYFPGNDLSLVFGLRYEWFDTNDRPVYNSTFSEANGIRNDANIDGLDILMPRIGFTWGVRDDLQLRGGFGLYSGGNPTVWLSNSFSNDGLTNAQFNMYGWNRDGDFSYGSVLDGTIPITGTPGASPPVSLYDRVAAVTPEDASDEGLVLLDPGYKQPADWKVALGFTWDMPGDIQMDFDWLHSRMQDSAMYVDVSQEIVGWTLTGHPRYDFVNGEDNFMLTNSEYTVDSDVFSVVFSKYWDNGLDLTLGYAFTDAEEVVPMQSFVAYTNFVNPALNDINAPLPGTSNYEVPHRFTLRASYAHNFFGDYLTRIALYGYSKQGQPQSYTMGDNNLEGNGSNGRHLLYVPTGLNDPNAVFDMDQEDINAFFTWIGKKGLKPGMQQRNAQNAKWTTRFDLYFSQELPTFIGDTKAKFYVKVYNLGNLINDSWGIVNDSPFAPEDVVDAEVVTEGSDYGKYQFNGFNGGSVNDVLQNRSLWDVRLGIEFQF